MKVTFDSEIFLNDLFKQAVKLARCEEPLKSYTKLSSHSRLSIGLDIHAYGPYNARMAVLVTDERDTTHIRMEKIEIFEEHIGNLRYHESFTDEQLKFINGFKCLLGKCFECFGKRWHELSRDVELAVPKYAGFRLVEKGQFPWVYFDELRCYSVNQIVRKFFQAMFKCLGLDTQCTAHVDQIKNLCVTVPTDYHTYQRLLLKNCLRSIGIEKCMFVNKLTSLAVPFLAKNKSDRSQKLIIDFSSG